MNRPIDLYGIYVPSLLLLMLLAWLLNGLLCRLLARLGLYRHVWHPPLFNLALYILLLGALTLADPGLSS